jgi:hypothetical protein
MITETLMGFNGSGRRTCEELLGIASDAYSIISYGYKTQGENWRQTDTPNRAATKVPL